MSAKKIVVIGGSAAGPKAAAKARRTDETAEIILIQKDADLSMASCGYPYYVGGTFDQRAMLISTAYGAVRDPSFFMKTKGIDARTLTEAVSIDRQKKTVKIKDLKNGQEEEISYDSLILTTGATPVFPPVPGRELQGITTLQSMKDADYLRKVRDEGIVKKAVIIGGGLNGLEACEALNLAKIDTAIVERLPHLLSFLDEEMAMLVENHLRSKKVELYLENGLASFVGENGKLTGVQLQDGKTLPCDLAVVAVGVRPNAALAKEAGLEIGATGGIVVDTQMRTSDPDIYAAGDCIEIPQLITGKKVHAPYGDLANLEGRVAGENAALAQPTAQFPGTLQTGICKVFDFAAGTTGLSEKTARQNGFDDIETVINASPDKPGFMTGKLLISKMVVDRKTGRVLGVQCVGPGDVSKQIAIWATALKGELGVEDMVNADLPYAPPFSLAIDHSIATAHLMQNKLAGRLKGVSAAQVKEKMGSLDRPLLLDVRDAKEYEAMHLGLGEKLVPLDELHDRLGEISDNKEQEIVCYCKISLRGYEAALLLEAKGYKKVRVMEGGVMAWPYAREK
ncbi:MAG: FAD-dependent oxidoreductase [Bdellovibrionales bacterium]